jgi:hypothetical protein
MQETLCRMAMVRQNMFEAAAFPLNQPFFDLDVCPYHHTMIYRHWGQVWG